MLKILVAPTTFAQHSNNSLYLLNKQKYDIIFNTLGRKYTSEEIQKLITNVDGIIAGTELYNEQIIKTSKKLKVISRLGVGIDNIDLHAAKKKNIQIFKTRTTPAQAVAELTLGLMLDVARKITIQNQNLKSGVWQKEMGSLLNSKTLGIIGLGIIGKTLVNLIKGFNFKILAFDLFHDDKFAKENKITYCDIDTLLSKSDIVSVHLNLTAETKGIMNEQRLNKMKPESVLINTSRGEIIDEFALFKVLNDKRILGAGLDVYNEEPYTGPLKEFNNVILTPHIGAYAKELRIQMEIEAAENLIKGLEYE